MAYVVLKGMTSGYKVKQVILQCVAAGAPQVSRISSPSPVCLVDVNETLWLESSEECWCLSGQQADSLMAAELGAMCFSKPGSQAGEHTEQRV